MGAGDGPSFVDLIDHRLDGVADSGREQLRTDRLLVPHQAVIALILAGKSVGSGAASTFSCLKQPTRESFASLSGGF
jgi:hypothetical protein